MSKYNIIVPVYNTEKYIKKCMDSLINQTFTDFEIIIIDDGSTDSSMNIITSYKDNRIRIYQKANGGVSSARNYGVSEVQSDYFLFVDSDDYIDKDLLYRVDGVLTDEDVLSFNMKMVTKDESIVFHKLKPSFNSFSGENAIKEFIYKCNLFDTPVNYVYKTSYFKKNSFLYKEGLYHEDFGLTPLVILKAHKVTSLSDILYYYYLSDNSITRTPDYNKTVKKAYDMLEHFDFLYSEVDKFNVSSKTKKIFNSFIANCIINKAYDLNKPDRKKYIAHLKQKKVTDLVLEDSLRQKIKKMVLKVSINLYLKMR